MNTIKSTPQTELVYSQILKMIREALGLIQKDFARSLFLSPSAYHNYESGKRAVSKEIFKESLELLHEKMDSDSFDNFLEQVYLVINLNYSNFRGSDLYFNPKYKILKDYDENDIEAKFFKNMGGIKTNNQVPNQTLDPNWKMLRDKLNTIYPEECTDVELAEEVKESVDFMCQILSKDGLEVLLNLLKSIIPAKSLFVPSGIMDLNDLESSCELEVKNEKQEL